MTFSEGILVYLPVLNHLSVSSFAARACIAETRKEARAEAKLLESAATRILLECTLHLLDDELRLCLSPSGKTYGKIKAIGKDEFDRHATRGVLNGRAQHEMPWGLGFACYPKNRDAKRPCGNPFVKRMALKCRRQLEDIELP